FLRHDESSAGPLCPPGPDAAEREFSARPLVAGAGFHRYRIKRGAEVLQQLDQLLIAVAQALNDKLVLVDVDDDGAAGLDPDAVGGVEAAALRAEDLSHRIRLGRIVAIHTAGIRAGVGAIGGLVIGFDAPSGVRDHSV